MANSTIKYPLNARRELAVWVHAANCFRNCAEFCALAIEGKYSPFHKLFKPLTASAIIEYAKPFLNSRGLGRTPELIVADGHMDLHRTILRFRNKIVAHIDTDGGDFGANLHCVRIDFHSEGTDYIVEEPKVHPALIPQIKDLSEEQAKRAHYHAIKHIDKIRAAARNARVGLGEFVVDLKLEEGGLLKQADSDRAELFWD